MGTEVVVEGLTKSFGRHVVWRDISLSLPAGEVSVMLGPSGTGKTVFLKALVGLIRLPSTLPAGSCMICARKIGSGDDSMFPATRA